MNRIFFGRLLALALCVIWSASLIRAEAPLFHPRTLLGGEYWGTMAKEGYLDYLSAVKPDLIHAALLGPELCSSVYGAGKLTGITPVYPPVGTVKEYLDWWREFNAQAHQRGVKVQATFSLTYVWGDPEKNTGFFKYYSDLWEADVLGEKPSLTPEAFLRIDAEGKPVHDKYNDWYTYAGCPNNPVWRQLLKNMVKAGIDAGFDGFMVQFPYFEARCTCEHCQEGFKKFLAARHSKEVLAKDYGIADLAAHKFTVIGSPEDKKNAKLDLVAREFGAISIKDCFDDVFIDYGRTLNPELVVSMWTHFRQFVTLDSTNTDFKNYMDERALLPIERWGKGENYLWYSSPIYTSDLKNKIVGDSALDSRVLRAMAGDTAFELLKYDYYRWRLVTAESLANGGVCFGAREGGWSGGSDREQPHHLQTYYKFIRDNDQYLNQLKRVSYADVAMIYPRQALFTGEADFFATFRDVGRALLEGHILFDAIIDQKMTLADLTKRRVVIVPAPEHLTTTQAAMLKTYAKEGGKVILCAGGPVNLALSSPDKGFEVVKQSDRGAVLKAVTTLADGVPFSSFDAAWTVQVYADRQPAEKRVLVHLVNFNRDETQGTKEMPIAAEPVKMNLTLPAGFKVAGVKFLTPETKETHLGFTQQGDRVQITAPKFLVYGMVMIQGK